MRFLRSPSILPILLALAACGGGNDRPGGVLLISVDSLRADHLSCYGYRSATRPEIPTSPVIDSLLARDGLLFERAVATTSWTLPSHMALLTGMPNELHGVRDYPDRLHPSQPHLAQAFRDDGWRTAGFYSGPNLHPIFGFSRGFERYVDCGSSSVADPAIFGLDVKTPQAQWALTQLHESSHRGVTGPKVVAAFETWFEELGADEPFFAFVHLWDVHYDYVPPREFDLFDPDYTGTVSGRNFANIKLKDPTHADLNHLLALYDGEIRSTDDNIGRLLSRLESAGRLDDTLVILTSDHGDEFLEHAQFGHRDTLYEEVMRVPLILRWPGVVPAGERSDLLVSLVDVAPTVLDLCGLRSPERIWGRSLRPAFRGTMEHRDAPMELTMRINDTEMRGLHAGGHKVVREAPDGDVGLFNLEKDPDERRWRTRADLAADDPRIPSAERVWQELDATGASYQRAVTGALPEGLQDDLSHAGYTGFDEGDDGADTPDRDG